jgi:hypothetical protein
MTKIFCDRCGVELKDKRTSWTRAEFHQNKKEYNFIFCDYCGVIIFNFMEGASK